MGKYRSFDAILELRCQSKNIFVFYIKALKINSYNNKGLINAFYCDCILNKKLLTIEAFYTKLSSLVKEVEKKEFIAFHLSYYHCYPNLVKAREVYSYFTSLTLEECEKFFQEGTKSLVSMFRDKYCDISIRKELKRFGISSEQNYDNILESSYFNGPRTIKRLLRSFCKYYPRSSVTNKLAHVYLRDKLWSCGLNLICKDNIKLLRWKDRNEEPDQRECDSKIILFDLSGTNCYWTNEAINIVEGTIYREYAIIWAERGLFCIERLPNRDIFLKGFICDDSCANKSEDLYKRILECNTVYQFHEVFYTKGCDKEKYLYKCLTDALLSYMYEHSNIRDADLALLRCWYEHDYEFSCLSLITNIGHGGIFDMTSLITCATNRCISLRKDCKNNILNDKLLAIASNYVSRKVLYS